MSFLKFLKRFVIFNSFRYYLTHTKDAQRQKAINLVTGQEEREGAGAEEDENEKEEEENISRMVTETIQFLVPTQQTVIAGWGLINACQSSDEIDTVVILTRLVEKFGNIGDGESISETTCTL